MLSLPPPDTAHHSCNSNAGVFRDKSVLAVAPNLRLEIHHTENFFFLSPTSTVAERIDGFRWVSSTYSLRKLEPLLKGL